jgi:hypothetical protein
VLGDLIRKKRKKRKDHKKLYMWFVLNRKRIITKEDVVVPPLFVFTVTFSFKVFVLMSLVIELQMMSTFPVFFWLFLSLS